MSERDEGYEPNVEKLAELFERMGETIGGCICTTCVDRQVGWVAEHRDEWLKSLAPRCGYS